jgi:hypothetical protein
MSLVKNLENNNIDKIIEHIDFSELKKQPRGGCLVFINYRNPESNKKEPLYIHFPKLFTPFGPSCFKKEQGKIPKYNLTLSLDKKRKGTSELEEFLSKLDKLVKSKSLKTKSWKSQLPNNFNKDLLEAFYTTLVKKPNNSKYDNTFNMKLPINWKESKPDFELFNSKKDKLDLTFDNIESLIPKTSELKGIFKVSHIWFVNRKFGVSLTLKQSKVYPRQKLLGFAIEDDSDDEQNINDKMEKLQIEDSDED